MRPQPRALAVLKVSGLILTLVVLVHLAFRIVGFIHIFGSHAGVALTQEEVAQAYTAVDNDASQPSVPRIIHQIFHNWTHPGEETLPLDWQATRQTCFDLNPEWEHWLWTERKSLEFLEMEYPWFMSTYLSFTFPVQKIDALRYFLMRHYGGIYVDLDNGCNTNLEPLRFYPAWVTDGGHGALSNNILGAEPQHPYWILMTESLITYAWDYPLPYLTIMYASGQWFETVIWEKYHQQRPEDAPALTRVMMDGRPGAARWVFFNHSRGGTWDNWDNHVFGWVGENLILTLVLLGGGGLIVPATAVVVWRCVKLLISRERRQDDVVLGLRG